MKKIAFCAAAGNGISPLEQIMIKKATKFMDPTAVLTKDSIKTVKPLWRASV